MTIDELVRQTLREWSGDARVPEGLADRALGRRRRARSKALAVVAGATAAVVVLVVVLVVPLMRKQVERIETLDYDRPVTTSAAPSPARDIRADPDTGPPMRLVAAYDRAVYAYHVWRHEKTPDGKSELLIRTWFLYDDKTGGYEKTPWALLDVAPGGGTVAVLEELPARRVGLISGGGEVRWIDLERRAGGLAWSPDGSKLLVTNYDGNPAEIGVIGKGGVRYSPPNSRTGFTVVDPGTGQAVFHGVPWDAGGHMPRGGDFRWSMDGTTVWESTSDGDEPRKFYDLEGNARPVPDVEKHGSFQQAGLSPSGRWLAADAPSKVAVTAVKDLQTGTLTLLRPVAGHWIEQLVAWADDDHLIAWACESDGGNGCVGGEFRNRLVLVSRDGTSLTPLSGFRKNSQRSGSWEPLVSRR
ncbi:hypothetical protein GCM10010156_52010 [Planobispora rosea]|uniref:WD40 repeat domain-containing protein n=1 Tax=Planobispora rosea TaxID=35762 RepID=A0A8J3S3R7_PLARO|nr:WD40 repeat domain-containing protein [Planobispora rosea]GGS87135.1 hypothetical protein GCM10010156_52010 [Planobispora rosea]GIH86603.1 hypothetical protein Pro02_50110 [Planobispora rosea]